MTEVTALVDKIDRPFISSHVELVRLLRKGEGINDLLGWTGPEILLRWINHHLYRGGHEVRVSNFRDDVKDCDVYVKVLKQILPKKTENLEQLLEIEDLETRASRILGLGTTLELDLNGISANSIAIGNEDANMTFVAALFLMYPSIRLPAESEIKELFAQLDGLRVKLRDGEEARTIILTKIKYLEIDIDELVKRKDQLEEDIKSKRDELSEKSEQYNAMRRERSKEIVEVQEAIEAKTRTLEEIEEEMRIIIEKKERMEDEKKKLIQENKEKIFKLEGNVANLNSANDQLRDLIHGRGCDLGQMEIDLAKTEAAGLEKSWNIKEYLEKSTATLSQAAGEIDAESLLPTIDPNEDDIEALKNNLEAQEQLLKRYEETLEKKRSEFAKHKAEEAKRIEDLNRSVADYLGEEQANADDAMANIKHLLELMIDKCKKQTLQVHALEITIEKKNNINDLMAEKIKKIAEESIKPKVRGRLRSK
eukprot:Ihof_evm1s920 gene=Ihof_evmTU1s920